APRKVNREFHLFFNGRKELRYALASDLRRKPSRKCHLESSLQICACVCRSTGVIRGDLPGELAACPQHIAGLRIHHVGDDGYAPPREFIGPRWVNRPGTQSCEVLHVPFRGPRDELPNPAPSHRPIAQGAWLRGTNQRVGSHVWPTEIEAPQLPLRHR